MLKELKGSEKQIAWANKLRNEMIEEFNGIINNWIEKSNNPDTPKLDRVRKQIDSWTKVRDFILETKTDAKFYIDNRNREVNEIWDEYRKDVK